MLVRFPAAGAADAVGAHDAHAAPVLAEAASRVEAGGRVPHFRPSIVAAGSRPPPPGPPPAHGGGGLSVIDSVAAAAPPLLWQTLQRPSAPRTPTQLPSGQRRR